MQPVISKVNITWSKKYNVFLKHVVEWKCKAAEKYKYSSKVQVT